MSVNNRITTNQVVLACIALRCVSEHWWTFRQVTHQTPQGHMACPTPGEVHTAISTDCRRREWRTARCWLSLIGLCELHLRYLRAALNAAAVLAPTKPIQVTVQRTCATSKARTDDRVPGLSEPGAMTASSRPSYVHRLGQQLLTPGRRVPARDPCGRRRPQSKDGSVRHLPLEQTWVRKVKSSLGNLHWIMRRKRMEKRASSFGITSARTVSTSPSSTGCMAPRAPASMALTIIRSPTFLLVHKRIGCSRKCP